MVLGKVQEAHGDQSGLACTDTGHQELILLGSMVEVALEAEDLAIEVAIGPQVNIKKGPLEYFFVEGRHGKLGRFLEGFGHRLEESCLGY
jgi:hypothetical protein